MTQHKPRRGDQPEAPSVCHLCGRMPPLGGWRCCLQCWQKIMRGEQLHEPATLTEPAAGEQLELDEGEGA